MAAQVAQTAQSAVRAFLERWNESQSSITRRLPTEMLVQCFAWLDFRDRLTISHVSRSWRHIALAEATLWTRLELGRSASGAKALLERAGAALLDLGVHDDMWGLWPCVAGHMWHVRSLAFYHVIPDHALMHTDAPALEVVRVADTYLRSRPMNIPAVWCNGGAPKLRVLEVPAFELPSLTQPLLSLRVFKGVMTWADISRRDAQALFTIFPRLSALHLTRLTPDSLIPIGPIPHTLCDVTLVGEVVASGPVDFSAQLQPWIGHPFRSLQLHNLHGADLDIPVQLFVNAHGNAWCLSITLAGEIKWQCVLGTVDGRCGAQIGGSWTSAGFARRLHNVNHHLSRLAILDVGASALLPVTDATLTLPALRELTIIIGTDDDVAALRMHRRMLHRATEPLLSAPQLDTVAVDVRRGILRDKGSCLNWFAEVLPLILNRCGAVRPIQHVEFDGPSMEDVQRLDLVDLFRSIDAVVVDQQWLLPSMMETRPDTYTGLSALFTGID